MRLSARIFYSFRRLIRAWQLFLIVAGPGILVMVADNDAGGITTYSATGAKYGYSFIWIILLLIPITYFVQEMTMRIGVVTKRGFAEAVFEGFGPFWGWFTIINLVISCWLTLVSEYIGITAALGIFHFPPWASVLLVLVVMTTIVSTGRYWTWEKIALAFCLLNIVYVPAAIMVHPSVNDVLVNGLIPNIPGGRCTGGVLLFIMANLGTTICPWMIFFQQSAVVDKGVHLREIPMARFETFIGSCITQSIVSVFIIVLTGTLLYPHTQVQSAETASRWMINNNNSMVGTMLAIGLMSAGFLGTICISLASSWSLGEVFGWAHSLNKKVREAPWFYMFYFSMLASAGLVVLLAKPATLIMIIIFVQVTAATLLPACMIFLILLSSDKKTMGAWANKPIENVINSINALIVIVLSFAYNILVLFPNLLPKDK
jgi:NRAMP (natural resistance-associated macrophage protein)-like metal ion transporter